MKSKMNYDPRRLCRSQSGLTLSELMIAALIFAVVATAGFQFYSRMHLASMAQDTISELQHQGRSTLRDIKKTVRLAGFDLGSHVPFEIKTDTLAIYYSMTQTVDTVLYYLQELNSTDYTKLANLSSGTKVYRLMKKTNSNAPALFAEFVNEFNIVPVNARTLVITLKVQADRRDDKYTENNGYRTYTQGERVSMRNVG